MSRAGKRPAGVSTHNAYSKRGRHYLHSLAYNDGLQDCNILAGADGVAKQPTFATLKASARMGHRQWPFSESVSRLRRVSAVDAVGQAMALLCTLALHLVGTAGVG